MKKNKHHNSTMRRLWYRMGRAYKRVMVRILQRDGWEVEEDIKGKYRRWE